MIQSILLPLALLGAPADTPTEPIDEAVMTLFIASGDPAVVEVCDSYRVVVGLIDGLGLDAAGEAVFVEMVDAFHIINVEQDSLRLTPEARDLFVLWLHTDCTI